MSVEKGQQFICKIVLFPLKRLVRISWELYLILLCFWDVVGDVLVVLGLR